MSETIDGDKQFMIQYNTTKRAFMICTAAHRQEVIELFQLLVASIIKYCQKMTATKIIK